MLSIAVHVYLTVMDGGAWLLAIEKCFCGIQSVWIGVQFFYGQGLVNIPRAKLLRSLRRLTILLDGQLSIAEYRRLAGFLVHAWVIGMMDRSLIALLFNPVTWALKARAPLALTKVCLTRFHYLVEVYQRWHEILSAGSGTVTSFLAAMPSVDPPAVLPPCLDLWFDARKEEGQVVVGAFCHGVAVRFELPEVFSIPHAEAYAVPIGLLMLESSLPNLSRVSVQLHSDALATALNLASGAPKTPIMLQAHAETVRCSPMQQLRGRVFITQCYGTANPAGDSASRSGQDETGQQHVQCLQRLCDALGVQLCWVDTVPKSVTDMIDRAVAILQGRAAPTLLTAADDAFAVGLASAKQSGWVVAPSPHIYLNPLCNSSPVLG